MIVGSKWGKDLEISVHKELWCFQVFACMEGYTCRDITFKAALVYQQNGKNSYAFSIYICYRHLLLSFFFEWGFSSIFWIDKSNQKNNSGAIDCWGQTDQTTFRGTSLMISSSSLLEICRLRGAWVSAFAVEFCQQTLLADAANAEYL